MRYRNIRLVPEAAIALPKKAIFIVLQEIDRKGSDCVVTSEAHVENIKPTRNLVAASPISREPKARYAWVLKWCPRCVLIISHLQVASTGSCEIQKKKLCVLEDRICCEVVDEK